MAIPLILIGFAIAHSLWTQRPQLLAAGRNLHLDPAKLRPMQPHLFETVVVGRKVRFVVGRSRDNIVHVALAACRVCYRSGFSDRVQNGEVICRRCNGAMGFEQRAKKIPQDYNCDLVEIPHRKTTGNLTVLARDIAAASRGLEQGRSVP